MSSVCTDAGFFYCLYAQKYVHIAPCHYFLPTRKPTKTNEEKSKMKKLMPCIVVLFLVTMSASAEVILKLGTTTSVDNSGLLRVLLPPFEKMLNVRVDVISVGTGKAMELGKNGDVDVLIVHAKEAEEQFIKEGSGVNRREFMFNDFVIVGPPDDPAGIKSMKDAVSAMKKIAEKKSPFISRGDNSGTHQKEKSIWKLCQITPSGSWYMESGQGMEATLLMAKEKSAYTISDRGTYLAFKNKTDLQILFEGDMARLGNPYSIIAINPAKYKHVNYVYAMALVGWVTSVEGQKIIGNFKTPSGEIMFHPTAIP
ncbi:MAG: substrate-binding domain-containing protein [Candidatus Poribacteria bacterium]